MPYRIAADALVLLHLCFILSGFREFLRRQIEMARGVLRMWQVRNTLLS
jgi:hypothetical protein